MSRQKQLSEASKQIQSELFTLTYGVLVAQILEDVEDTAKVNTKLDKIGHSIGVRLIDDIFARNLSLERCKNLKDTADALVTYGFKPYLGITPKITDWSDKQNEFTLVLDQNPLTDFVELNEPEQFTKELESNLGVGDQVNSAIEQLELDDTAVSTRGLNYCQLLCGIIRGALEMVQLEITCEVINDKLRKKQQQLSPVDAKNTQFNPQATYFRIKFIRRIAEAIPVGDS